MTKLQRKSKLAIVITGAIAIHAFIWALLPQASAQTSKILRHDNFEIRYLSTQIGERLIDVRNPNIVDLGRGSGYFEIFSEEQWNAFVRSVEISAFYPNDPPKDGNFKVIDYDRQPGERLIIVYTGVTDLSFSRIDLLKAACSGDQVHITIEPHFVTRYERPYETTTSYASDAIRLLLVLSFGVQPEFHKVVDITMTPPVLGVVTASEFPTLEEYQSWVKEKRKIYLQC